MRKAIELFACPPLSGGNTALSAERGGGKVLLPKLTPTQGTPRTNPPSGSEDQKNRFRNPPSNAKPLGE
jgi:hypothetical protein